MENGDEEVKKAAKYITKSNIESGVAYTIRELLKRQGGKADGGEHTQSLMCMEWVIFWIRCWKRLHFQRQTDSMFLGDLIDRGPDPAGVLDLAMERKNIIALKGNHEDAFVDWYDTVPDKIHNRYYYNTYDFLMDSRRTRERLPEYVEFMRKNAFI